MLSSNSLEIYLRLLDAQVQPIVQYGSELWDLDKAAVYTENVHLFAETKVLGIDLLWENQMTFVLHFVVTVGIFLMLNSGHFYKGKPDATGSRNQTLIH